MSLAVYNTLSGKKEPFKPLEEGKVKLYLCGPTVYDFLHIGNFRGAITFNLIRNWLEYLKYKVTFVYNYTDVDDKIIKKANAEGVDSLTISERFIKEFETDFNRLGLRKHDHNPKVTDYIPEIISFVKELVDKEKAYVVDGEVFYSIDTFPSYGKLSKKKLDELEVGQRVEVDNRKKNPQDFVLWKPSKEGEPSWNSPWGEGRPGWHIECSAMIKSILGDTIDIHGGGIDLIFPHHENEIAQGEGCTGHTYCNYWIHNNFINMNDEKMSKSLGNVVTARAFMDKFHPEILKYLFLSAHYRSMLSVTDEKITQTISALDRIYSAKKLAEEVITQVSDTGTPESGFTKKLEALDNKIKKALNDDFNTAEFISFIFEGTREFNILNMKGKKWGAVHKGNAQSYFDWLNMYGSMSALFHENAESMLQALDDIMIRENNIDLARVDELIHKRSLAREAKDWAQADLIRDELMTMNIELQDGQGKGWTVKK